MSRQDWRTPPSDLALPEPIPGVTEARGPGWVLRLGRWQDVLADVVAVDAILTDPPYGARTHAAAAAAAADDFGFDGSNRQDISYASWSPEDVAGFVSVWGLRCASWFAVMTSHDLIPAWEVALGAGGRYVFPPVPWVSPGSRVRLAGDGPSNWTCWIVPARPRQRRFSSWGTLPGAYVTKPEPMPIIGGKPLGLMRALVRVYSRPGDLICDPCAGGATTIRAAVIEGRRAIGAEMDPKTFDLAVQRLEGVGPASETQPNLFRGAVR